MKSIFRALVFMLLIQSACSNQSGNSSLTQDTTRVDDESQIEDENGGAYDPNTEAIAEAQTQLNYFIKNFDDNKAFLNRLVYQESNEYDGKTITYYYQDDKLAYMNSEISAEGGYEEKLIIKTDPDFEYVLSTANNPAQGFGQMGYFSFMKNREPAVFQVVLTEDRFLVRGLSEATAVSYLEELESHFNNVKESKNQFVLSEDGSFYEYYVQRKNVDSQYGEVEITKSYRVDKDFFEKGL